MQVTKGWSWVFAFLSLRCMKERGPIEQSIAACGCLVAATGPKKGKGEKKTEETIAGCAGRGNAILTKGTASRMGSQPSFGMFNEGGI